MSGSGCCSTKLGPPNCFQIRVTINFGPNCPCFQFCPWSYIRCQYNLHVQLYWHCSVKYYMTKNFHLRKTSGNFKIFLLVSTIEIIILGIVSKIVWQHYLYRALIMKATSIYIQKLSSFQLHTKLKGFAYIVYVGFESIWALVIGLCKFLFLFCFLFLFFCFCFLF